MTWFVQFVPSFYKGKPDVHCVFAYGLDVIPFATVSEAMAWGSESYGLDDYDCHLDSYPR
jgi:hypothetical protein